MNGALSHLRVLDLSRVLAGPWASQTLADLGAEVIKVERPGTGDDTRGWGPPWVDEQRGESAYFTSTNRAKKSITVDLAQPEGQEIVRKLSARSDVLLENYKVGALARYGLDAPRLLAENPRLVYCSITGFGQTGPYRDRAGYDFLVQGMGGLMSITGASDGEPMKVGVAITDILTGMYAATAVLAALVQRERSGRGQHIDLALLDVQVAMLANQAQNFLVTGENPLRLGNGHPSIVPYQSFATRDGHIVIAVGNDAQFRRLCAAAGCPGLADDARFATNAGRVRNRDALLPMLAQSIATRTSREWIEALEAATVPCGPINSLKEVFADPQVVERGMRVDARDAVSGTVPLVRSPIRLSETPVQTGVGPPALGEHTDEVLTGLLGMTPAEVDALRARRIV
ncbi:MAG TPA: CaiB/BaiF CoA-transferase family protein [Myxococcales bacterium]|nr:CaiB/BaiF CoA-transferase family protein [Myxococcales bacterium]